MVKLIEAICGGVLFLVIISGSIGVFSLCVWVLSEFAFIKIRNGVLLFEYIRYRKQFHKWLKEQKDCDVNGSISQAFKANGL